jgi:tetratricopeptide (TPR) repeat protein
LKFLTYTLLFAAILFGGSCSLGKKKTAQKTPVKNPPTAYDKRKFDYLFVEGLKEKMNGNYPEAIERFQKCITANGDISAPYYEIARILHQVGKDVDAIPYAKKASALEPENMWYQLLLAECYKNIRKYSEAAGVYNKLINSHPEKLTLYYDLAYLYMAAGKPGDAVDAYNKIESKIGITEDISLAKQKIWMRNANYNKAAAEVQQLINAFPKEARYYVILGTVYSSAKQKEKALEAYLKAVETDPEYGQAYLYLHDHYRGQDNKEKAFEELKKAFRSPSVSVDTKTKIVLAYFEEMDLNKELKKDADTLIQIMFEVHPDDARTHTIKGDFLYKEKKYADARESFRQALALDKSRYPIWHQVMLLDSQLDDYASLEKTAKEARDLFPNEPVPYLFYGATLSQRKSYADAIDVLNEGRVLVFNNPGLLSQFYTYLGDAYNKLGNHVKSDESFDKALALDPENATVLNNYAYFLSLRGVSLEKALKMSEKANRISPDSPSFQDTHGWVLFKMGKYSEAKKWIEKAIEAGGEKNPTLLEHMGDVLFQLGEKSEALKYWEKARDAGGSSDALKKKISEKKYFE